MPKEEELRTLLFTRRPKKGDKNNGHTQNAWFVCQANDMLDKNR